MATWEPTLDTTPAPLAGRDRRLMMLVGAVAALLLVSGLLLRGSVGLQRSPGERIVTVDPATGAVTSGGVELVSSVRRPLFAGGPLAPGASRTSCLEIEHRGSVPLETVALRVAETAGADALLGALDVTIERGPAGTGADCRGFLPEDLIARGSLAELAETSRAGSWPSWTPSDGDRATYRFTVVLSPDAANDIQGRTARADFLWVAAAEPTGTDLSSRTVLVAVGVARDAVVPLLALAVVAVLFLGIQDRIDRRDPKLAMAAVAEVPSSFGSPLTWSGGRADRDPHDLDDRDRRGWS